MTQMSTASNAVPGQSKAAAVAAPSSEFISFAIDEGQYGVDIMAVREIKGWSQINPLPGQPDHMRGVLNLRGVMVPIVDLRCRWSDPTNRNVLQIGQPCVLPRAGCNDTIFC